MPDNPCWSCLCDGGEAVACAVMQCSQPSCDHWQPIEDECCSVKCIPVSSNNSSRVASFSESFMGIYSMFYALLGI